MTRDQDTDAETFTTRRNVMQGLAAAGAASLAGCSSIVPGAAGKGEETTTVRYAQVLPPATLDPVHADDVWSAQAAGQVFEALYTWDSGTDLVPQLAAGKPKKKAESSGSNSTETGDSNSTETGGSNSTETATSTSATSNRTQSDSATETQTATPTGTDTETAKTDSETSATAHREADGPVYSVSIREDATFQNGDAVTATDVKYSLEAPVEEDAGPKWALEPIVEIRTPDEHTLEFHLAHPYPGFEDALTQPIVPKAARESNPERFATDPVGSGPYQAEKVKEGKYVVLERWQEYWGDVSGGVDRVKFVPNHSGLARSMSLRTEQNDIVERVQPKLWQTTKEMPATRLAIQPSYHSVFVGMNCNAGPTAKPAVREAIDYLVDMDELVEHFVDPTEQGDDPDRNLVGTDAGNAEWRQYSPMPDRLAREWDLPVDEWREIPRAKNTDEAKRLLNEADVQTWTPKIAVPEDMLLEKFADAIVHELSNVGFRRARTVKYTWPEFRKKLRTGSPTEYNLFLGSWSGYPDPDSFAYPLFHENVEGVTNFTFYQNEPVMNQLREARETTARPERKKRYERAFTTLLEDRVHLPAFTLHNTFGYRQSLRGFEPHPISGVNPRFVGPDGDVSLET